MGAEAISSDLLTQKSWGNSPASESMNLPISRLYAIVDAPHTDGRTTIEIAEVLLQAGARLIQYRDKSASSRLLFENSQRLAKIVHAAGGTLVVNDRADVALAAGADGVHLGQADLPVELGRRVVGERLFIGLSTHNIGQVREADRSPADYLAFGPIFATASKDNPDPVVGLEGLRAARQATSKPLVAIGGITLERARLVIEAGADSVAVIGDLLQAEDVAWRAREFLRTLRMSD